MTPVPLRLLPHLAKRLEPGQAAHLMGIGNGALLAEPLLGFIASRACPAHVLIETLDRVPQWIAAGRIVVSGFHSPLEQQVLKSLLRREGRAVRVLARGFGDEGDYRLAACEREALEAGRMLILTTCPPAVTRITRAMALARNALVLAFASEIHAPHITESSPLAELLEHSRAKNAKLP
jgi:predicted Rossmann fold nucleotide-binding protein DprA/Smf involved in DNA uptake